MSDKDDRNRNKRSYLEAIEEESSDMFADDESDTWDPMSIGTCSDIKDMSESVYSNEYNSYDESELLNTVSVLKKPEESVESAEDRAQIAYLTKRINDRKAIERDWKVVSRKEEEDDYAWMDSLVW
jgi:hypothetical protein